jgi:hypothetical protein
MLPTQLMRDIGLLLDGNDLSPFLDITITCAIFQQVGYLHCKRDLLKII